MDTWKWNLAFQCVVNIGVRGSDGRTSDNRGSENIRTRVVEADVVPVVATILDNYMQVVEKLRAHSDEKRTHGHSSRGADGFSGDRRRSSRRGESRRDAPPPISIPISEEPAPPDSESDPMDTTAGEGNSESEATALASDSRQTSTERPHHSRGHRHGHRHHDRDQEGSPSRLRPPRAEHSRSRNRASTWTPSGNSSPVHERELNFPTHARNARNLFVQPNTPTTPIAPTNPTPSASSSRRTSASPAGHRRLSIRRQASGPEGLPDHGADIVLDERPREEPRIENEVDMTDMPENLVLETAQAENNFTPNIAGNSDTVDGFTLPNLPGALDSIMDPSTTPTQRNLPFPPGADQFTPTAAVPSPEAPPPGLFSRFGGRDRAPSANVLASVPRDEDIIMSLQLLAYVSKYCPLRPYFQQSHLVPKLKIGRELQQVDDSAEVPADADDDNEDEYCQPDDFNIFPLVEKFTVRHHSEDMKYWAGVVMRNLCRKDKARGDIRQCAYYKCDGAARPSTAARSARRVHGESILLSFHFPWFMLSNTLIQGCTQALGDVKSCGAGGADQRLQGGDVGGRGGVGLGGVQERLRGGGGGEFGGGVGGVVGYDGGEGGGRGGGCEGGEGVEGGGAGGERGGGDWGGGGEGEGFGERADGGVGGVGGGGEVGFDGGGGGVEGGRDGPCDGVDCCDGEIGPPACLGFGEVGGEGGGGVWEDDVEEVGQIRGGFGHGADCVHGWAERDDADERCKAGCNGNGGACGGAAGGRVCQNALSSDIAPVRRRQNVGRLCLTGNSIPTQRHSVPAEAELRQARLAQHNHAGVEAFLNDRCIGVRECANEGKTATGGAARESCNVVLENNRKAMERRAGAVVAAFCIECARNLFNRTISDTPDDEPASLIELQEASSSSTQVGSSASQPGKKSFDTSVVEAPAYDYEDIPRAGAHVKTVGVQGISALPSYQTWLQEKAAHTSALRKAREFYQKAKKFVLRRYDIPPTKDGRHIYLDAARKEPLLDERIAKPYIGNSIRSSRYNLWNFIPKQLVAQFSKLANAYFLCVSILQMIPGLSTTGTYTTIVPLLVFVCISIGREGYDDLRRYRLDKEENNREVLVLHAYQSDAPQDNDSTSATARLGLNHWATTKWKDVQVGDVVKLNRDQSAPADIVLLHSEGENGVAYIETMALDGETNLKSKSASPNIAEACDTVDRIAACDAHIVVEDPNLDLYNFEGRVTVGGDTAPLSGNEVVYRGSILRNTPAAVGMVIYSGEECKIRMNANKNPRIKAPRMQSLVNKIVIIVVLFVILLSVFNAVAYTLWNGFEDTAWYLEFAGVDFGPVIVSFIIMFNTMIPLSLYVSLEIVKVSQMVLLNDIDMYDPESDTPMEARTSTINEELGQVSYVFSDKTGTLTDNSMKFRKMSVAGTAWLHDADLKEDAIKAAYKDRVLASRRASKGKKTARPSYSHDKTRTSDASALLSSPRPDMERRGSEMSQGSLRWKSSARPGKPQPEFATLEMLLYIQRKPFTVFAKKARFFLLQLALCHTCLPETREDGSINFQAASPDELALVQAAQELGYLVIDKKAGILSIKTFPNGSDRDARVEQYEILDVIEFSSKRKRMSVVVRFPDGRKCVVSKGADSIMMGLLKHSAVALQKTVEIEKRASKRKSMEAQQAMARKSEARDTRKSMARSSFSIGRPSIDARLSMATAGSRPLRDQVDSWLNERERDVDASTIDDEDAYHTPRPSGIGRPSIASHISEARSSLHDEDFDLVDEALVVDEAAVIERCAQHINDFATEGLRTLLYGYRFMSDDEYTGWKKEYREATTSLVDRQSRIERAGAMIERDLELGGATAIEDKLQRGVPETIDKLRRAGIKMWMLTGDKRETAINIGHSCRLIKDYSSVTILDHETHRVEQDIASTIVALNSEEIAHCVVVVDGQTLSMIEADPGLNSLFLDLAVLADSVVCCRASPSQKAGLVKAIRHKIKKSITLAIGDGANDIAMIQEAHVGIGITGKEGLQAARTSDYSIAQFRFLSKLLLVHGRWNYIRTCKYTLATFWKEMAFYLTQALFQRWAGYTGTSLHESWSLSMFNTLFTSLPVIFLGIFDQDLLASTLLAVPELYAKGQKSLGFNVKVYCWWMFVAASEAMIVFFSMLRLYGATDASPNSILGPPGKAINDIFPMGNLVFSAIVILVSVKLLVLEMHYITYMNAIGIFVSIGGWWLWNIILACTYTNNTIYAVKGGMFEGWGRDLNWWLVLILICMALLVLEVAFRAIKSALLPSQTDIFQALETDPAVRKRFEEAAALELANSRRESGDSARKERERQSVEAAQQQREDEVRDLLRLRTADGVEGDHGFDTIEMQERVHEHGLPASPGNFGDEEGRTGGDGMASAMSRSIMRKGRGMLRMGKQKKPTATWQKELRRTPGPQKISTCTIM
ncbi:hypothetical protein FH972_025519 [Carpinus fangiana]|uniref:P-type phospholipid transporter n=1 Tax=Carpinus fangiana TaxID=176857 RepID=A0A5N6L297_9ROSI|nr:hypothetical protein FH972_025519 [Carpinus fangiana]